MNPVHAICEPRYSKKFTNGPEYFNAKLDTFFVACRFICYCFKVVISYVTEVLACGNHPARHHHSAALCLNKLVTAGPIW